MKIMCPGHYCVLEPEDRYTLENNSAPVEALNVECPFCKEELRILNILLMNVTCISGESAFSEVSIA